jgi:hypothetical protein
MQNDSQPVSVSPESLKRGHEARDPHLRNALIIAASVMLMIGFCLATTGFLIRFLSQGRPMQQMQRLGIIVAPDLKPLARFPKPNLQIDDDHGEMTTLLSEENQKLESYGWIDRSNGIVRIPIERAMDLILQSGLPVRTNQISQTGVSDLQLIQERPKQR